jgi:hypothetical protein
MSDEGENPIGYGRPPNHTKFRKGQSGNRRGRPRGKLDPYTLLTKELTATLVVKDNGLSKKMRRIDVIATRLVNEAAGGSCRAFKLATECLRYGDQFAEEREPITILCYPEDLKL